MSPSTRTPPRPKGRHAFTVFSNNLLKINPINFMWVKNYSGNSTLCNKCSDSSEPIQSLLWIVGNIESHTLDSAVQCIQGWRGSTKPPSPSDNLQKASRTCPLCRAHSNFVVPSASGSGGEPKQEVINDYLARLKKTPCKYFEESVSRQLYCSTINPTCKFGNKCHYAHIHPTTGRPYEFAWTVSIRPSPLEQRYVRGWSRISDLLTTMH